MSVELSSIHSEEIRIKIQEFNAAKKERRKEAELEKKIQKEMQESSDTRLPWTYRLFQRPFTRSNAHHCWTRCGRTACLIFMIVFLVLVVLLIIAWKNKQYLAFA